MLIKVIKKLQVIFTKNDKQFLIALLFFSILIAAIETVGIAAIMPFISLATDFTLIQSNEYYGFFYDLFNFTNEIDFVIGFGVGLIIFYIFRSAINLFYFYLLARFSQGRYHLLAYNLFKNYMGMSYHEFVKKNSSMLTKSIVSEANGITAILNALLFMISEILVAVLIYSMMLYINWKITFILTIILVVNAVFMTSTVSKKIKKIGDIRADLQKIFYEIINRTFGNFKIIKLHSSDKDTLQEFSKASYGFAQANIKNLTLQQFPRLFLEAIGFGLIVFIITFLVWKYQNNIQNMLAVISMFVLALYRLLPSINRIMSSYNQIMFNHKSLEIVHSDLMHYQEDLGDEKITFSKNINLKNIYFEYKENIPVLSNINLNIKKGEKIAFIGESGGGKSTLVDIIIGLYRPIDGKLFIDNIEIDYKNIKDWRAKIGYIPQSVYLFDGSVGENISYGMAYDKEKVDECLKQAKIYDFLQKKDGDKTVVGEGGIMLSGGQKQRIAIARALYSNPEVLVLDEATSALDDATEAKIMDEIYEVSLDKTLIIIAHRLSTIKRCDVVYKLEGGVLKNV